MYLFPHIAGFLLNFLLNIFSNNYVIAIIAFTIIARLFVMPINHYGSKCSERYSRLHDEINRIKNSGGDVHQVEQELTELYEKNNVKTIHVIIKPLTALVSLFVFTGFIKAITMPLTYILRLGNEAITALSTALGASSQMQLISLFEGNESVFGAVLSADGYARVSAFVDSMIINGFDLSRVPTVNYMFWLPIIALTIRLIQIGVSAIEMYVLMVRRNQTNSKAIKKNMGISLVLFAIFSTLVFTVPSGLCVYWIASSVIGLITSTVNFTIQFRKSQQDTNKLMKSINVVLNTTED